VTRPRVVLRRLRRSDLAAFQAYRHDPELGRYQGWSAQSDADAQAFIDEMAAAPPFVRGQWLQLGIADAASDALIGDIGLCLDSDGRSAEIGFTLARAHQGRGLATAAVAQALQLLWDRDIERVVGITDTRNRASLRLLERLGFVPQQTRTTVLKGEPCDEVVCMLERPPGA
jgi:aminoglycoside 6'-N-acetyltransferase